MAPPDLFHLPFADSQLSTNSEARPISALLCKHLQQDGFAKEIYEFKKQAARLFPPPDETDADVLSGEQSLECYEAYSQWEAIAEVHLLKFLNGHRRSLAAER